MRVLVCTWAASSHYFTMVVLSWGLRANGHEVRVASPPGSERAVERSGLPLVVTGPKPDLGAVWQGFTAIPDGSGDRAAHEAARADRALRMFLVGAETMVDDLLAFGRDWRPDLVVFEPRVYAALRLAAELDVPAVRLVPGPDYTLLREERERPLLADLWQRWDLGDLSPHGDLTVDPCPPGLQLPGSLPRQRMRFVPYAGPAVLPLTAPAAGRRPRVFLTVGSLIGKVAGHMSHVHAVLDQLAGLDVDILLGIFGDQRDLLGPLPERVSLAEDMPLHLLLPSCDVIIHQGGAGTALTSVSCGVPQLTLPSVGDCFLNGRQVAAAGAGHNVPWLDVRPGQLAELVADLIDDAAFRRANERLIEENERQPPPAAVAGVLAELAAAGRGAAVPA
ncbi:nucleotide disphospho-sugar-binding domain-containing protein [Plantactinospora siamensis]|uniref:Nucleotide disphospho-sugar-binding domain-containing protein n=1 Tax=Plantactinospora siamensis TaxID=555372 RepID=A0ABV6NWY5_9ACTN